MCRSPFCAAQEGAHSQGTGYGAPRGPSDDADGTPPPSPPVSPPSTSPLFAESLVTEAAETGVEGTVRTGGEGVGPPPVLALATAEAEREIQPPSRITGLASWLSTMVRHTPGTLSRTQVRSTRTRTRIPHAHVQVTLTPTQVSMWSFRSASERHEGLEFHREQHRAQRELYSVRQGTSVLPPRALDTPSQAPDAPPPLSSAPSLGGIYDQSYWPSTLAVVETTEVAPVAPWRSWRPWRPWRLWALWRPRAAQSVKAEALQRRKTFGGEVGGAGGGGGGAPSRLRVDVPPDESKPTRSSPFPACGWSLFCADSWFTCLFLKPHGGAIPVDMEYRMSYLTDRFSQRMPTWQFVLWLRSGLLFLDATIAREVILQSQTTIRLQSELDDEATNAELLESVVQSSGVSNTVLWTHTGVALVILFAFWFGHCRYQPFEYDFQNRIESVLYFFNVVTILLGTLYTILNISSVKEKSPDWLQAAVEVIMVAILVASVIGAAIYLAYGYYINNILGTISQEPSTNTPSPLIGGKQAEGAPRQRCGGESRRSNRGAPTSANNRNSADLSTGRSPFACVASVRTSIQPRDRSTSWESLTSLFSPGSKRGTSMDGEPGRGIASAALTPNSRSPDTKAGKRSAQPGVELGELVPATYAVRGVTYPGGNALSRWSTARNTTMATSRMGLPTAGRVGIRHAQAGSNRPEPPHRGLSGLHEISERESSVHDSPNPLALVPSPQGLRHTTSFAWSSGDLSGQI